MSAKIKRQRQPVPYGPTRVVLTTSVWYPRYDRADHVDRIRGMLALDMFRAAAAAGYAVVVVDKGSHRDFKDAAQETGSVRWIEQTEQGISGGRRQAVRWALTMHGVAAIVTLEPEKPLIPDIAAIVEPIFAATADIVLPARTPEGFRSLPRFQEGSERATNAILNALLRERTILSPEHTGFDWFFGPKAFTVECADLFLERYETINGPDLGLEGYINFLYRSVLDALMSGEWDVVSVPAELYRHPGPQTLSETDNPVFEDKRCDQSGTIVTGMLAQIDTVQGIRARMRRI